MIDAACFPGSSGSPVFIFNEHGYQDKKGNITLVSSRVCLLGVLFAGPQQILTGDIRVVNIPRSLKQISFSSIPINFGLIIKAEHILEIEAAFKKNFPFL
ncbi:hypothetical protein NAF17_06490 [Mucilaginibacter sp. RB4R14]|uniref:hypothetical protein n=1 Tax=Mucilaginibacter aurantiaciroseus TaxID=2949308 RepID=UPI002091A6FE|nr:hypothetical protein [Mucilaginibacter aurantiaciroseus]MCO5935181.1 hypothetical protein [Mucilaginibacter aurantiaciroseus]